MVGCNKTKSKKSSTYTSAVYAASNNTNANMTHSAGLVEEIIPTKQVVALKRCNKAPAVMVQC